MTITAALRVLILSSVIALLAPVAIHAESVLWSGTTGTLCSAEYNGCKAFRLSSVSHQVAYNVRVRNADTGIAIPSGSTVPSGTRVHYEFLAHAPEDIYWFGTGGGNDSPNGDWVAGAASAGEICIGKNYVGQVGKNRDSKSWANFTVAPPSKSIGGLPGDCTTASDGVSKICTLVGPASVNAQFVFASTFGRYHGQFQRDQRRPVDNACGSGLLMSHYPSQTYSSADDIAVPQQTIGHTVSVEADPNQKPSKPTLSSGGACVVGEAHTISMTSADPDGDTIRYGIDWNADGSIDEFSPATGYVPSGTTQQASRTYATSGSKTVHIVAIDVKGSGSEWASISFNCAGSGEPDDGNSNSCPVGYGGSSCTTFVGCPGTHDFIGGLCVPRTIQCVPGLFCSGGSLYERYQSGSQCLSRFNSSCTYGCSGVNCLPAPSGEGNITASPSLVRSGEATTISWTTQNMIDGSCTVTENNADITDSGAGPSGTFTTSGIRQETRYTLSCTDLRDEPFNDSVRVNIIPIFEED